MDSIHCVTLNKKFVFLVPHFPILYKDHSSTKVGVLFSVLCEITCIRVILSQFLTQDKHLINGIYLVCGPSSLNNLWLCL